MIGKTSSPTRRGASASTAMLPAGASTGAPAAGAGKGWRAVRFHPDDADGTREVRRDAGDEAAAADWDEHRVKRPGLVVKLKGERGLAELDHRRSAYVGTDRVVGMLDAVTRDHEMMPPPGTGPGDGPGPSPPGCPRCARQGRPRCTRRRTRVRTGLIPMAGMSRRRHS